MIINKIFNPGLQEHTLARMDEQSLIRLSGVNRFFKLLLNNDFFEKLFHKKHPELKEASQILFREISTFHPSNFWKIASFILSAPPITLEDFFDKRTYFKEQIHHPLLIAHLRDVQAQAAGTLKPLAGNFHADPLSPLDIARKRLEKSRDELKQQIPNLEQEIETLMSEARPYLEPQYRRIFLIQNSLLERSPDASKIEIQNLFLAALEGADFAPESLPPMTEDEEGQGYNEKDAELIYWTIFHVIYKRETEKDAYTEETFYRITRKMGIPQDLSQKIQAVSYEINIRIDNIINLRNEENEANADYIIKEEARATASRNATLIGRSFTVHEFVDLITNSHIETLRYCFEKAIKKKSELKLSTPSFAEIYLNRYLALEQRKESKSKIETILSLIEQAMKEGLRDETRLQIETLINALPYSFDIWHTLYLHSDTGPALVGANNHVLEWKAQHFHEDLALLHLAVRSQFSKSERIVAVPPTEHHVTLRRAHTEETFFM